MPGNNRLLRSACLLHAISIALLLVGRVEGPPFDALLDSARVARGDGRYERALLLLDRARQASELSGSKADRALVLVEEAWVRHILGEFNMALTLLYDAENIRRSIGDKEGLAEVYNNIGAIQQIQKNYPKALSRYMASMAIYEELDLPQKVARSLNNLGSLYEDMGDPEEAMNYHRKSEAVWRSLNSTEWQGVSYMHIGACMDLLGRSDSALYYYSQSLGLMRALDRDYMVATVSVHLGSSHLKAGHPKEAIKWCSDGLRIAEEMELVTIQQKACDCLYRTYERLGRPQLALDYHKRFVQLRDSVFGQENVRELTRIEMNHVFEQRQLADSLLKAKAILEADLLHQREVAREREGRNMAIFSGVVVFGLAIGLWSRLRFTRRSRAEIQRERDRSEDLLLNILPEEVAAELKVRGEAEAKLIENATVLFTDFKGFTAISERLSPRDLVRDIHECFSAFDRICEKHGIEKIKTIGDAYMAAGGLPTPKDTHAVDAVRAALEIRDFIEEGKALKVQKGLPYFEIRIGVHSGPVIAGIVGLKKFAYDIWGDTVNTASRMESSGDVGRVNISGTTFALVKDASGLTFTERGKVHAKGKGELEMYYVDGCQGKKDPVEGEQRARDPLTSAVLKSSGMGERKK